MAQFDVHAATSGAGFLLDCQADLLSHLNTRFVAPLLPIGMAPKPAGRLNPTFEIAGETYVMMTQFAAAIELGALGPKAVSFADKNREIMNALDMLLTGV